LDYFQQKISFCLILVCCPIFLLNLDNLFFTSFIYLNSFLNFRYKNCLIFLLTYYQLDFIAFFSFFLLNKHNFYHHITMVILIIDKEAQLTSLFDRAFPKENNRYYFV